MYIFPKRPLLKRTLLAYKASDRNYVIRIIAEGKVIIASFERGDRYINFPVNRELGVKNAR